MSERNSLDEIFLIEAEVQKYKSSRLSSDDFGGIRQVCSQTMTHWTHNFGNLIYMVASGNHLCSVAHINILPNLMIGAVYGFKYHTNRQLATVS